MYEDQHASARQGRPAPGQRCPSCGNLDPDPLARFCGVCGTPMGVGASPDSSTTRPTVQYQGSGPGASPYQAPAVQPYQGSAGQPMPGYAPMPTQAGAGPALPRAVYAVPVVDFAGAAQIGAAISAVFSLLPCLAFAALMCWAVTKARWVLDSWTNASFRVPVPVVSVDVPVNYIDLFRMRALYDSLIYWDDRIWILFAALFLVPWLVAILSGLFFGTILAAIYNAVGATTGGMRVTLVSRTSPPPGPPVQQGAWIPGPPAGQPPAWPNQGWPNEPRR